MDIGATSLEKEIQQIEESSSSRCTSYEVTIKSTVNTFQGSVATSEISSLLSYFVEPLTSVSKMPQLQAPRSGNEQKAILPRPVTTQNFPIPPHIMGRNVENPVEDFVAHGRRMQKPRLGVKVPYRNLTSQIVTQDEIAKEILERSLKKHPVRDNPEKGDLFFAIKLTQRLANRLSPSSAQGSSPTVSQADKSPVKTVHVQHSPEKSMISPNYSVSSPTCASDNKELLAILEGDVDPNWASKPKLKSPESVNIEHVSPLISNTKLDPVLEKELALKQLSEFQTNSRRRKSDKVQKGAEEPRRRRSQIKKEPVNKENGISPVSSQFTLIDPENNNGLSVHVLQNENNVTSPTTPSATKPSRKHKLQESKIDNTKRPRLSGKKNTPESKNDTIGNRKKTDRVVRKSKVLKSPDSGHSLNSENRLSLNSSPRNAAAVKAKSLCAAANMCDSKPKKSSLGNSANKKGNESSANKKRVSNTNSILKLGNSNISPNRKQEPGNDIVTGSSSSSISNKTSLLADSSINDGLLDLPRFTTPLRTYSPKRKVPNVLNSPKTSLITNSTTKIELENKLGKADESEKLKVEDKEVKEEVECIKEGTVSTTELPKKKEVKEKEVPKKKKSLREVHRLLMDEGAINLLYEVEHGQPRRRSSVPVIENDNQLNQKRTLKSIRRKKKDLLLKTRLVKNAVLRLSSSPSSLSSIAARAKRRIEPSPLSTAEGQNKSKSLERKFSLDSHDSLKSPLPLTPVDPPSPQSFTYPQLPLPAEASRIIRRHSSSSNFSSRSASPSNVRIGENQNTENKSVQNSRQESATITSVTLKSGKSTVSRKKGVPIFIRKPLTPQTYKGKRKKENTILLKNCDPTLQNKILEKLAMQNSKGVAKVQSEIGKAGDKKTILIVKKISIPEVKAEMAKNFQKGFKINKTKLKKTVEVGTSKTKKDTLKNKTSKLSVGGSINHNRKDIVPGLSSCLAAAASAFAAEAKEERNKKTPGSRAVSRNSSPTQSRSSKSPTPTNKTAVSKKESRIVAPLSPTAATYSNMLKTLENESQRQRKKDSEEGVKQRSSGRQNAGTFHYREINLRRYENMVQVILTPQSTKMKNALNLQVLKELKDVLHQLKKDDTCRAVLLTSTGSSFCQGVDLHSLLYTNNERRKTAAQELAQALKEFMKCLALFNKPIVAGVHGAAIGLGVTMLPFFDMVVASDKATFYAPYAKLGQVPEGAAILTLPHMFGNAVTSELLFGCRKLTASEALHFGLVTRILWPDHFQEELIPAVRNMANQSAQSMEATKALLRHGLRTKLDAALESESHLLVQHWSSAECQANFRRFLDDEDVGFQKQKLEA